MRRTHLCHNDLLQEEEKEEQIWERDWLLLLLRPVLSCPGLSCPCPVLVHSLSPCHKRHADIGLMSTAMSNPQNSLAGFAGKRAWTNRHSVTHSSSPSPSPSPSLSSVQTRRAHGGVFALRSRAPLEKKSIDAVFREYPPITSCPPSCLVDVCLGAPPCRFPLSPSPS